MKSRAYFYRQGTYPVILKKFPTCRVSTLEIHFVFFMNDFREGAYPAILKKFPTRSLSENRNFVQNRRVFTK